MIKFKEVHRDKTKARLPKPGGEISRRELLKLASPLGKVTLDSSRCTGCGLCALDCPTQALYVSTGEETNVYQLLFKHELCLACGQCVEVCPEQCLHLERTLELDRLNRPAAVLFAGSTVRCRRCGSTIGAEAMIHRLQTKLQAAGLPVTPQLELCPICKTRHLGEAVGRDR